VQPPMVTGESEFGFMAVNNDKVVYVGEAVD